MDEADLRSGDIGLNVAQPIYQSKGNQKKAMAESHVVLESSDPEVRAYAEARVKAWQAAGRAALKADGYKSLARAQRRLRPKARTARIREGTEPLSTKCQKCGCVLTDHLPQFSAKTGVYICRYRKCTDYKEDDPAEINAVKARKHNKGGMAKFVPVDDREFFSAPTTIVQDDARYMREHDLTDEDLGWVEPDEENEEVKEEEEGQDGDGGAMEEF
ncbi:Hypothetical protein D9617_3g022050 [Elsinoe fawcettii]|nr:Hypothetical protein D9617_3g022050 [Elsinoe fawcettii]